MVDGRDQRIAVLVAQNATLREEVFTLKDKIGGMTRTIAGLEKKLGRNSQNSSMPPSTDTFVKPAKPESPNRKARRALGRKPGKQPGAPGHHLARVDNPDKVIVYTPETCSGCGADLADAELVDVEVRQVFDIPEPTMIGTEPVAKTALQLWHRKHSRLPERAKSAYHLRATGQGVGALPACRPAPSLREGRRDDGRPTRKLIVPPVSWTTATARRRLVLTASWTSSAGCCEPLRSSTSTRRPHG